MVCCVAIFIKVLVQCTVEVPYFGRVDFCAFLLVLSDVEEEVCIPSQAKCVCAEDAIDCVFIFQ